MGAKVKFSFQGICEFSNIVAEEGAEMAHEILKPINTFYDIKKYK